MSKDVVISGIFSLPVAEQREIFLLLQDRLADDLVLDDQQEQELDRRLDRLDREGPKGEKWDSVIDQMAKGRGDARRSH